MDQEEEVDEYIRQDGDAGGYDGTGEITDQSIDRKLNEHQRADRDEKYGEDGWE